VNIHTQHIDEVTGLNRLILGLCWWRKRIV